MTRVECKWVWAVVLGLLLAMAIQHWQHRGVTAVVAVILCYSVLRSELND